MAIKPYLQLVRLPNLFTAAADSLAGWILATGSLQEPRRWVPLVLASVAIYAGGIVLNDVFDHDIDLRERPGRPLPSGRVSRRFAAWFGGIALAMGPCLAALSGSWASLVVAAILAACVLGYDAGLKRTILGPEVMGACRGLNLLLGLSQEGDFGGPYAWMIALGLAVFVAGVTWISRSEVESGKTRGIAAGLVLEKSAVVGLVVASVGMSLTSGVGASRVSATTFGLVIWCAVAAVIYLAGRRALRTPIPEVIQKAVKTGVLALVWLDVAAVATVRGPAAALAVAALWVPAFLLGRWLYST